MALIFPHAGAAMNFRILLHKLSTMKLESVKITGPREHCFSCNIFYGPRECKNDLRAKTVEIK